MAYRLLWAHLLLVGGRGNIDWVLGGQRALQLPVHLVGRSLEALARLPRSACQLVDGRSHRMYRLACEAPVQASDASRGACPRYCRSNESIMVHDAQVFARVMEHQILSVDIHKQTSQIVICTIF